MKIQKMNKKQKGWIRDKIGKSVLISIGINNYVDDKDTLSNCINDAEDIYNVFKKTDELQFDSNSTLLCSNILEHTGKNYIVNTLKEKCKTINFGKKLVLYYSGHGLEIGDEFFIVPSDGKVSQPSSLLSLGEIIEITNSCKAKYKIFIFDACRKVPNGSKSLNNMSLNFIKKYIENSTGTAIIFSCRSNEISLDNLRGSRNSVFTTFLLDGLSGAQDALDEHYLTVNSLYRYILRKSQEATMSNAQVNQIPVLNTTGVGDLIFGLYNINAAADSVINNTFYISLKHNQSIFDKLGVNLLCLLSFEKWNNTQLLINELIHNVFKYNSDVNCTMKIRKKQITLMDNGKRFNPLNDLQIENVDTDDKFFGTTALFRYLDLYKDDVLIEYEYLDNCNYIHFTFNESAFNIDKLCTIRVDSSDDLFGYDQYVLPEGKCDYYYYYVPYHSPCRSQSRDTYISIIDTIPIESKLVIIDNTPADNLFSNKVYKTHPRIIYGTC